jgi:hypothetical protein
VSVFREAHTVGGRPVCETCNQQMWLLTIKLADDGNELRTFECSKCAGSMTIVVERAESRSEKFLSLMNRM